jgi:hypothetical protein
MEKLCLGQVVVELTVYSPRRTSVGMQHDMLSIVAFALHGSCMARKSRSASRHGELLSRQRSDLSKRMLTIENVMLSRTFDGRRTVEFEPRVVPERGEQR